MPKEKGFLRPDEISVEYKKDLGDPGEYPFTRGLYPEMYRRRKPTIRQFHGEGLAPQTNARSKKILAELESLNEPLALSIAYDIVTLMGYDSDDPHAVAQVGWDGVAVDTLKDIEELFAGIPLDTVSVSKTINAVAAYMLAMHVVVAEKNGFDRSILMGTTQTDILKEHAAQKEYAVPEEAGLKLVIDMIEFCAREMPMWHPVSISEYHIAEAGATPAQGIAYTLGNGMEYVRGALARGLSIDSFAPKLSFFFRIHNNFLEEIAKIRAARKLWARIMRERFGATDERSMLLRLHTQTSGSSLMREEPLNNIIRVTIQSLAAHLAGHQSGHANSYDEVWSVPTEEAVKISIRIQQIIQEETGICDFPDLIGGSYHIEQMTKDIEEAAEAEIDRVEEMGGMLQALKVGYPQRQIHLSALAYDAKVEQGCIKRVGVSSKAAQEPPEVTRAIAARRALHLRETQMERLAEVKRNRDRNMVAAALLEVREAAQKGKNVMPALIEAARAYVTVGEIRMALQSVYGVHREREVFIPFPKNHHLFSLAQKYRLKRPLRVLLTNAGLDGHTRPLYELAGFLRNLGLDVILPGLHTSYIEDARRALQEDVQVVAVSTHVGDPIEFFGALIGELERIGKKDAVIVGGGIVDSVALDALHRMGVKYFVTGDESFERVAQVFAEIGKEASHA